MNPAEFRIRKALAHYGAMLQMARAQKHYPVVLAEAIDAAK
jgi:hypothetical protein